MTSVVVSLGASFALAGGAAAAKDKKHGNEKPAAQAAPHAKGGPSHPDSGKPEQAENKAGKDTVERAEHAEFKSKLAELRERRAQGQLSPAELEKELAALRASRDERRREHREALRARWGNKLAQPSAQQELEHHERRMARLERMALLVSTHR
jgi:hypothetical protein